MQHLPRETGMKQRNANAPVSVLGGDEPEWVQNMREHYLRTGFYRTEDVRRILGDPRHPFEGRALDNLVLASRIKG